MGARASADLPSQRAAREHQRGHAVVGGDERVLLVTLACHEKGSLELLHLPRVGCGEQHRGLMRERRDVLIARCRQEDAHDVHVARTHLRVRSRCSA